MLKMYGNHVMLQQPFNRLILLQLLEIRDALCRPSTQNTRFYQDILINGIEAEYPFLYEEIAVNEETIPKSVSDEVQRIVKMFEVIQRSLNTLDDQSLKTLSKYHYLSFNGFKSASPEHKHFIYLNFRNRYQSEQALKLSSEDALTLHDYRKMLQHFKPYKHLSLLTYEQLQHVCVHRHGIQEFSYHG